MSLTHGRIAINFKASIFNPVSLVSPDFFISKTIPTSNRHSDINFQVKIT